MSQRCPHCQAKQTAGSLTCAHCGASAERPLFTFVPLGSPALPRSPAAPGVSPEPEEPKPAVRGLSWKIPTLLAILAALAILAVLAVLAVSGLSLRPFRPQAAAKPPAAAASPAVSTALPAPSLPGPPPAESLSVALRSSAAFPAAVTVGKAVMIVATVEAATPGRPTTVTVFYQRDQGQELLMAQAQGTQCRASWTPARPGEYSFTATAREDQARVARAAPLTFHVAAAPKPLAPHKAAVLRPQLPPSQRLPFQRPPSATKTATLAVKPAVRHPVSPSRFHVAAAMLPFERGAAVLATALHQRGYPAVVRPHSNGAGNRRYVVQTGVFSSAAAAGRQSQQLQHDGYPAFIYRAP